MNEFLASFRAQYPGAYDDMSDHDLLAAVHRKYYPDMSYGDFVDRLEAKSPSNTGPTPQPPQLQVGEKRVQLPPMVGGALDALLAFGNGVAFRVPEMLSGDTREAMGELRERAPGATLAAEGAGALTTAMIPMAAGTRAAAATPAARINQLLGRQAPSGARAATQVAQRGGDVVRSIMRKKMLQGMGAGAATGELIRRIF